VTSSYTITDHPPTHTVAGSTALGRPAHTVVTMSGDLDIASAPAWRERLTAMLRPGMGLLVLELSAVSFCDAAGLAVLIGTQRRACALGIALRLVAPRPQMARVLRLSGLDRSFTIHPTPAAAVAQPLSPQAPIRVVA
jgi:anti-anti-sigma factor